MSPLHSNCLCVSRDKHGWPFTNTEVLPKSRPISLKDLTNVREKQGDRLSECTLLQRVLTTKAVYFHICFCSVRACESGNFLFNTALLKLRSCALLLLLSFRMKRKLNLWGKQGCRGVSGRSPMVYMDPRR